jgi:hypothetical protein
MGRTINPATPGNPYDNGIYQADTRYVPVPALAVDGLPGMCGQAPPVGTGTECRRLTLTRHLHSDLTEINRETGRLPRMRNDWRARNLIGWIEFANRRLAYQFATWDLPACTCGDQAFPEATHDLNATYPACTC